MVAVPRCDVAVVAGASLDVLRVEGRTLRSAGGAGLYTALAAAVSGVRVAMLGPRPEPMPGELAPAAQRLHWCGPIVPPEELPRFEISHHGGGRATLDSAFWGAEARLTPDLLTQDVTGAGVVHVAALSSVDRQRAFVEACRRAGVPRVSAGTYAKAIERDAEGVRALLDACDLFFMNENEARLLYGGLDGVTARAGQVVCVTRGARGVRVLLGAHAADLPALPAREVDPTGAGDTFCGATLAGVADGQHPLLAARAAVALASEMVSEIGPARLLDSRPAPGIRIDARCPLDDARVADVATCVAAVARPLDFCGPGLPEAGQPGALDYFFAATLQQFGFWYLDGGRWAGSMLADFDGRARKGSDYLWAAWSRWSGADPSALSPARQARLELAELEEAVRSDAGTSPLPEPEAYRNAARAYGRDMQALGWTPRGVCDDAQTAAAPRRALLERLDHVGGYKEDPLRKKSALLALILEQRPERFLRPAEGEPEWPVVDYHVMRTCLRTGLVRVVDEDLRRRVVAREVLSARDEWALRWSCHEAVRAVQRASGKSMGAVDALFFGARRVCPEVEEPECAACSLDAACAHAKELFQPVRRTTFY